jgi:hypothetical protein
MKQLTKKQAIAFYESQEWDHMTAEEIVKLQLYQDRLCVPFSKFHEAIETVLGRSVFTHEFASDRLKAEFEKKCPAPTFEQTLDMIPSHKQIIIMGTK